MSSDDDNDSGTGINPTKGPRVSTGEVYQFGSDGIRTNSLPAGTHSIGFRNYLRYQGDQYDGERQLFDVLGYPEQLHEGHYVAKYERGPGIAEAIVEKPVTDCWGDTPEIVDAGELDDDDDDETDFEEEIRQFLAGDYTRLKPTARLRAADRWSRLLNYSLVLIGVSDPNVTDGDPNSLENEVDESGLESLDDINYLAVYDQRRVDWDNTQLVTDPTDERYQLPDTYRVNLGKDVGDIDIHHSRVLHVVEEPDVDELRSDSVYKSIYNRIDDLSKILGGSAEMFWRSAWPGLVVTPPTDADGVPMKFDDDGEDLSQRIENYRHNVDRVMRTTGNIEKLDTSVADPSSHTDVQYQDISAKLDMPMSIIRGNETGERATEQDLAMYHEYLSRRRTQHCEEQLIRPLIDRLLDWGVLSATEGGDGKSYEVEWPSLEEPTEQEEAETMSTKATALSDASGGKPLQLASVPEIRQEILDLDPERGSEAPDSADPEDLAADDLQVDEESPDVQDQFAFEGDGEPPDVDVDAGADEQGDAPVTNYSEGERRALSRLMSEFFEDYWSDMGLQNDIPAEYTNELGEDAFEVPEAAYEAAKRANEHLEEHGAPDPDAQETAIARMHQLIQHYEAGEPLAPDVVAEIASFHEHNRGRLAALSFTDLAEDELLNAEPVFANSAYGGEAAAEWATRLTQQMSHVEALEVTE